MKKRRRKKKLEENSKGKLRVENSGVAEGYPPFAQPLNLPGTKFVSFSTLIPPTVATFSTSSAIPAAAHYSLHQPNGRSKGDQRGIEQGGVNGR